MDIGEAIAPPQFVMEAVHSESTCPWHDKAETPKSTEMDAQDDDDDLSDGEAIGPMPGNSGKKLGVNMGDKEDTKIQVTYPSSGKTKEEILQWAPHHLIPGNASLKGSAIVPFMGDTASIKKFAAGKSSKILDGQSIGYNVNAAANGVWLPSPYALSMKGKWPTSQPDKLAYVVASIDQSGGSSQFHMCHTAYSNSVKSILDELASKMRLMVANGACDKANAASSDKFPAPMALKARLDSISAMLRRITSGPVWQPPYTDDTQVPAYIAAKGLSAKPGLRAATDALKIGVNK